MRHPLVRLDTERLYQLPDDKRRRCRVGVNVVELRHARFDRMVVDRERHATALLHVSCIRQTLDGRNVARDERLGRAVVRRGGNQLVRAGKRAQACVERVISRKQAVDPFPERAQRPHERKLRANAVAVRVHMAAQDERINLLHARCNACQIRVRLRSDRH